MLGLLAEVKQKEEEQLSVEKGASWLNRQPFEPSTQKKKFLQKLREDFQQPEKVC